jgi:hypothetical protein
VLGVACLLFVRLGWWRRPNLAWCGLAAAAFAFLAVIPWTFALASRKDAQGIMPLAYLREYVTPPSGWLFHLLLQYSWTLAAVVLRLRQTGAKTVGDLLAALRRGELLDVEFLTLVAVVGTVPGLLWPISGGGASYFFGIQRWVALPMLLAVSLSLPVTFRAAGATSWRQRLRALPLSYCLGWLFLGVALGTCLLDIWSGNMAGMIDDALKRRGFSMPGPDGEDHAAGLRAEFKDALFSGRFGEVRQLLDSVTRAAEKSPDPRRPVVQVLRAIDRLDPAEKRVTALFVPKRNEAYWKMLANPQAASFLGPAITGVAMIDGLPDVPPGVVLRGYGYEAYALSRPRPPAADPEQEKARVLGKARELGFGRVLVLDTDQDGRPRLWEWDLGTTRPLEGVTNPTEPAGGPQTGSPARSP